MQTLSIQLLVVMIGNQRLHLRFLIGTLSQFCTVAIKSSTSFGVYSQSWVVFEGTKEVYGHCEQQSL